MRLWYLRSRIGVGLEALAKIIPKFTEKDLVLAQRKSDKGVWRSELWSNRDFEANELILAPLSSQLKETHLMAAAHAVVGVPKHGRGAHPETRAWPSMVGPGPSLRRKGPSTMRIIMGASIGLLGGPRGLQNAT